MARGILCSANLSGSFYDPLSWVVMNGQDKLCDTCRQHVAIRRFLDFSQGVPRERRLCVDCLVMYPLSMGELLELNEHLLKHDGKCELCGNRACVAQGLPGESTRHVFCGECAERHYS
jgi:hypothetical protein